MVSISVIRVNTWITTHLPGLERSKAELARLADPYRTVYAQSGHV